MNIHFQSPPEITLATNVFINVPVILKYDDTPLVELAADKKLGFTIQIHLYHSDGTYLGNVNGSRFHPAQKGKEVSIDINDTPEKLTCYLENNVAFELSRITGESLKLASELFTPGGYMVRCSDWSKPELFDPKGDVIGVGGVLVSGCVYRNSPTGIWIKKNGSFILG